MAKSKKIEATANPDAPATDVPATAKKRGRPVMTAEEKDKNRLAREKALNEERDALLALDTTPLYRTPKFWGKVSPARALEIVDAIQKGGEKAKRAEIEALEAKLKALRG